MSKELLRDLVDRFLGWPVPADCYPDGIPGKPGRIGTNLLTADQARQMFEYVLFSGPSVTMNDRAVEPPLAHLAQPEAAVQVDSHQCDCSIFKTGKCDCMPSKVWVVKPEAAEPVPPIEPTEKMLHIGAEYFREDHDESVARYYARNLWLRMSAAAPVAPHALADEAEDYQHHKLADAARAQEVGSIYAARDGSPVMEFDGDAWKKYPIGTKFYAAPPSQEKK